MSESSTKRSVFPESESFDKLGPEVHAKLKHYVYLYADPITGKPFYVGKGFGDRILAHQDAGGDGEKAKRIEELRRQGLKPKLVIVRHGMEESEAFAVEAVIIEQIGLENLTNIVAGHRTNTHGRMTLSQIRSRYASESVHSFNAPTLLFRITRSFRYTMTGDDASDNEKLELYEATRGTWKIGANRESVKYAMAVYDNVIQEIYEIDKWVQAGTSEYVTRKELNDLDSDRYEFTGKRCEDKHLSLIHI